MRPRRIGLVFGLAFAMIVAVSAAGASAAPRTAYEIHFDGYCDGMHVNIPSTGLGTADTVDGYHTGCVTGGFAGTKSTAPNAAHITTSYGGFAVPPFQFLVNANHTWVIYQDSSGAGVIAIINSGTWSPGPPRADGPASGAIRGGAAAASVPRTAYDIHFDGYCDGMLVNIPSAGLGTADTVDGHHTGCVAGGLQGTKSTSPNAAHITTNYGGLFPEGIHFLVNANHTWVIYYDSGGGVIAIINSGTWSPGPPRGGGSPAAA